MKDIYSTAQYSTWKICTVQQSTVHGRYLQDRTVQYMEDIYSTVQYSTQKIFTIQNSTVHGRYLQCSTVQYIEDTYSTVQYDTVRYMEDIFIKIQYSTCQILYFNVVFLFHSSKGMEKFQEVLFVLFTLNKNLINKCLPL